MIESLLNLIFPPRCHICRKEGFYLCQDCKKNIEICFSNINYNHLDQVYLLCKPTETLKRIVHAFKYNFREAYLEVLSGYYIEGLKNFNITSEYLIIPIPLHYIRKFWRGYNQSELISRYINRRLGYEILHALKRNKHTKMQSHLNRTERLNNVKDVFTINKFDISLIERPVLLIDDIVTTGATLSEAAKVLKVYGFKKVEAMVLSRGTK